MVQNKQIMPILVIVIAMGFHAVDIAVPSFEITTEQLVVIDGFLAPFGLGGLIRAGHKTYLASKTSASEIPPETLLKLKELLKDIK